MLQTKMFRVGLIGAVVAAICCFTPALVIVLSALGLSAYVGLIDLIALPVLALGLAAVAVSVFKAMRA